MPDSNSNFVDSLSNGDKTILGGSVVLLIAMFLPWYGYDYSFAGISSSGSVNGFNSWGWLAFLALLALVAFWLLRGPLAESVSLPEMPLKDPVIYMILGGLEVLGVLLYWLAGHNELGGFSGNGLDIGVRFGLFIALIGGIVTVVGGYLKSQEPEKVAPAAIAPGGYGAPPPPPPSYGAPPPPPAAPPSAPPAAPPAGGAPPAI